MNKKIRPLLVAVAVVALSAPAVASANTPTLFDHSGKVNTSAKILATSTNFEIKAAVGRIYCAKMTLTAEVTHNASGTVRAAGNGGGLTTLCQIEDVPPQSVAITDLTLAQLHTATSGSGTMNLSFEASFTFPGIPTIQCSFASASVPFTYTAGVTNDTIKVANGNMAGTPAGQCEPGTLNVSFTLETDVSPYPQVWFQ